MVCLYVRQTFRPKPLFASPTFFTPASHPGRFCQAVSAYATIAAPDVGVGGEGEGQTMRGHDVVVSIVKRLQQGVVFF